MSVNRRSEFPEHPLPLPCPASGPVFLPPHARGCGAGGRRGKGITHCVTMEGTAGGDSRKRQRAMEGEGKGRGLKKQKKGGDHATGLHEAEQASPNYICLTTTHTQAVHTWLYLKSWSLFSLALALGSQGPQAGKGLGQHLAHSPLTSEPICVSPPRTQPQLTDTSHLSREPTSFSPVGRCWPLSSRERSQGHQLYPLPCWCTKTSPRL